MEQDIVINGRRIYINKDNEVIVDSTLYRPYDGTAVAYNNMQQEINDLKAVIRHNKILNTELTKTADSYRSDFMTAQNTISNLKTDIEARDKYISEVQRQNAELSKQIVIENKRLKKLTAAFYTLHDTLHNLDNERCKEY